MPRRLFWGGADADRHPYFNTDYRADKNAFADTDTNTYEYANPDKYVYSNGNAVTWNANAGSYPDSDNDANSNSNNSVSDAVGTASDIYSSSADTYS